MKNSLVALLALALFSSGCAIQQMAERQNNIEKMQKQAQENAKAAQAKAQTEFYVMADEAWVCPTKEQALANEKCDRGKHHVFNQVVRVVGQAPEGEVWKAAWFDKNGQHSGFIRADNVNELPDNSKLEAFRQDVTEKYPAEKKVPLINLNYQDLMTKRDAMKDRKIVLARAFTDLDKRTIEGDTIEWVMSVPPKPNQRGALPTLVRFESAELAKALTDMEHPRAYKCGQGYCDKVILVGHVADKTVDRVDDRGNVKRLPVIVVEAYADRFGSHGSL